MRLAMAFTNPHHKVRNEWLSLEQEPVIASDQPIFDSHHHLWDRPEGRYLVDDFMLDASVGHDVRASLFVQCTTGYLTDGPVEMRPLGEVETVLGGSKNLPMHPIGIIAFADLQLGSAVRPVLEALLETAAGKLCGIRNKTAYHADPAIRSNPVPAPQGLLLSDAFKAGAQVLASQELCLDIWVYHTQLDEVLALAKAVPGLSVILNHCGGPLGVPPYRKNDPEVFRNWFTGLAKIAALPNTRVKIGGFGLSVMGHGYAKQPKPPLSQKLAADWAPYVETCIDLFGSERAMFESNFPVDKGQFSYNAVWNTFKRLTATLTQEARDNLFWRTAARCYGINENIFTGKKRKIR